MTKLTWNNAGDRFFETGVDKGVFYKSNGYGVVWNGLKTITETLSGGEPTPYYVDGIKYLNVAAPEEFGGTIGAFMYPEEFAEYDGTVELYDGFSVNLQRRKEFGLSYRTLIGSDLKTEGYGYKLHIIYNLLASPTSKVNQTLSENMTTVDFSWGFTTRPAPVKVGNTLIRTAHVILDSTKVSIGMMRAVEDYLYGSDTRSSKIISLDTLVSWFILGGEPLEIVANTSTGIYTLKQDGLPDLVTTDVEGVYAIPSATRLVSSTPTGFYTLGP
jgi:hypothetical protein